MVGVYLGHCAGLPDHPVPIGHIAQFGKLKRKLVASLTDECFAIIEGTAHACACTAANGSAHHSCNYIGTTDSEHCFAVFMDELTRCLSSSPTSTGATPIFDRTGRPQDLLDAMYACLSSFNMSL